MKNHSSKKKLVLAKETLRALQASELEGVRGGLIARTLTLQVSCELKCKSEIFTDCGILRTIIE